MESINQLRKNGELNKAWTLAQEKLKTKPDDLSVKTDLLWVYYSYLKIAFEQKNGANLLKILVRINDLNIYDQEYFNNAINWIFIKLLQQNKSNNSPTLLNIIDKYMLHLTHQQSSESKSIFIEKLIRLIKDQPTYEYLSMMLTSSDFRKEDFEPKEFNHKKLMPLHERWFYSFSKSIINAEKQNEPSLNKYNQLYNYIQKHCKYQFAEYYYAKYLLKIEQKADALIHAKNFLIYHLNKSWAWELYAQCQVNTRYKTSAFLMAFNQCQKEEFSLHIRQELYKLFLDQGKHELAGKYASSIAYIRKKNNWQIPPYLNQYNNDINKNDYQIQERELKQFAKNESKEIIDDILTEEKSKIAVLLSYDHKSKKSYIFIEDGQNRAIKIPKYLINRKLFKIHFKNDSIIHIKAQDTNEISEVNRIKTIEGKINIKGNIGFLKDVFVSKKLLSATTNILHTKLLCIKDLHPKTKKISWRAIDILN
jgi:hypothetical protein